MDYGIYTTQGKKVLLGNRATVNGRDAIAYVKNGHISQRKITMTGRSIDRGITMRRLYPERFIMQPII